MLDTDEQIAELIETALAFAIGSGGDLVLLHVTSEEGSSGERKRMQKLTDRDSTYRPGLEGSEAFARDIGERFVGTEVPYRVTAGIGERAGRVASAVEEYDCDHVFIL